MPKDDKVTVRINMTKLMKAELKKYATLNNMTQGDAGGEIVENFLKKEMWKK